MALGLTWESFPDEGITNYNSYARSAIGNLKSNGELIEAQTDINSNEIEDINGTIGALVASSGVKVSDNDSTLGYLDGKLIAGDGISFTVGSPSGDETLTISSEDSTGLMIALAIALGG